MLRPFAAVELTALLARGLGLARQTKLYACVDLFSRPNPNVFTSYEGRICLESRKIQPEI